MPSPTRLFALAALLVSAAAVVPPAQQGLPGAPDNTTANAPTPDNESIVQTAGQVNQKTSAPVDTPPDASVPPTTVTAVDGTVTNTTIAGASAGTRRRSAGRLGKRQSGYTEIFKPLPASEHDASIEGTAYLTYTVVSNATYDVQACLDFCDTVDGCEFVNLYYEFNNYLLDFVFSQESNLKCAAYGDIHNATEKTNFGGQASYPQVGNETVPLTYITQSSGWAADSLIEPTTPDGYELVFGPTGGANNAPGYMGFAFLDRYDVTACAALCNGRGADPVGGVCQYFNIWRAVVDGIPTTYTCSMYYIPADASTAVNFGQGDLVVTLSRGYSRLSVLPDGGFEGYTACDDFCFTDSYANWIGTSSSGGQDDATVFFFPPYARTGHGSGLLGSADDADSFNGTLTPAQPLTTEKGKSYVVQAFVGNDFSGQPLENTAFVFILWNGVKVGEVTGFQHYTPVQATVTATGKDVLSFTGGDAPAWSFLDDISVFGLLE
ncbi:hypothetical protein DFH07DRAFT_779660 [Mycena maculata]|uniref:Fruit-body specific protein a n=1 Tax=Mycena maculata TaxID=230809 RepID=A0AAD7MXN8_9AGAR|nr:hypothetical protein DFH07DRAFT_779660 [Mycena maculata]